MRIMKQSFSSYFRDERRQCRKPFCMQRAVLAGASHNCRLTERLSDHLDQPLVVTPDEKVFTKTTESSTTRQFVPRVMATPVRTKVSTPRGLTFDNDTESKDAWSVSMATPLSEQVKSVGLDIANSSTSADESCSSVEHSGSLRVECDEFMGELISQKFVMKKETEEEDCRRTPLTLVARKLFSSTTSDNLVSSHSIPTSPDLISSTQETQLCVQETKETPSPTVSSPTCSQDLFNNNHATKCDITPSHVVSSTPVSTGVVGEGSTVRSDHVSNTEQTGANVDSTTGKPDSAVEGYTGDDSCQSDTTGQNGRTLYSLPPNVTCNRDDIFHNNSDLMDELFANHLTNLTQAATEQLLRQEEEEKLVHSTPVTSHSGSGCGDDVMNSDVTKDHVINKDEHYSTVTPTITASSNDFKLASCNNNNRSLMRKSTKPFKAPRLAKEVSGNEQKKLLEQYSKKFPSLAVNDSNSKTPSGDGGLISCGFTSAGSGKALTVSAATLRRTAMLVEDFSIGLISEGDEAVNNDSDNNPQDMVVKAVKEKTPTDQQELSISTEVVKEVPVGEESKMNRSSYLVDKEISESAKETHETSNRSHETNKRSHETVENYNLENIDMEQFSVFTQIPDYGRAADDVSEENYQSSTVKELSDAVWTPSITPIQKEVASSYITPGGSFNPASRSVCNSVTPCRQSPGGQDDDDLKTLFNTQLVKQFLDFNSSNEVADQSDNEILNVASPTHTDDASPTHTNEISPCINTDKHTHSRLCDNPSSPTHTANINPIPHNTTVLGLATASGKAVTVSADNIDTVKKLLDDKCNNDKIPANKKFPGLYTSNGDAVSVSEHSMLAVKQLFSDDVSVQEVNDTNSSTTDNAIVQVQQQATGVGPVEMMSLHEPSHDATLTSCESCDPHTAVAMEATTANTSKEKDPAPIKRRRDPLYTTPEAVMSDRAHPKRMCFTPLVTNSDNAVRTISTPLSTPTAVTMTTNRKTPKFITPFKAHRMSSTPRQKTVTTPLPVWRKKLGMSSSSVPFHYSNNVGNKSANNDSGIGSSLPPADQPLTANTVEEQEGLDKQFEVTDTQMESFLAPTQCSVVDDTVTGNGVVKPQPGTLFMIRSKALQRISLPSVTGCMRPGRYSRHQLISLGVHPAVVDVTAATAINFQFDVHHYFSQSVLQRGNVTIGDNIVLQLDSHNDMITRGQLQKAFFASPGVDSNLITVEWFSNHYRWIVWKLASLEVSFPHSFAGKWLTPHWLLLHLKYRYDREIDFAHRSCLKKILERDDNSTKSMVLVITEVCSCDDVIDGSCDQSNVQDTIHPTVKMSDGWYNVGVVMDTPLKHILSTNQIMVGCKLYISGAKLIGSCDPCSPLECNDSVMLKINANSTRRAHWNVKLGFQACPLPFPVPMSSLYPDGGLVGCVHVTVARTHPLQHMERTDGGSCVFRTQRKEEMVAKEYNTRRQQCLEDLSVQVREEFEKELNQKNCRQCYRRRRSMSRTQISKLTDGQKIEEAINSVPDPVEFEEQLSVTQKALLDSYRHGLMERQRRELEERIEAAIKESEDKLPPLRNVVPLLKVRVVGHPRLTEWNDDIHSCLLTVWRPTDDVMGLLQEGVSLKLYNVMASSPHRYSPDLIQLATNRGTRFEQLTKVDEDLLRLLYKPRKVTPLVHLVSGHSVDYGQVDIIGIIVTVLSSHISTANGTERAVDKVYITDDNDNVAIVTVWDGVESMISKDHLTAGQVACFINLSSKGHVDTNGIPTCSTTDLSIVTIKPRHAYLKPTFQSLQKFIKVNRTILKSLKERIACL